MRPKHITVTALALDADGIAQAQQTAGATPLTLNGVSVRANDGSADYRIGYAVLSPPRAVSLQSSGNLSGINFTIVGRDRAGRVISETIAGPNNNTVTTTKVFALVVSVTPASAVGTNVQVGWVAGGLSQWIPMDRWRNPFNVGLGCVISGSPTFTVEHTFDDVFVEDFNEGTAKVFPHETIEDETGNVDGNYAFAVSAIRLRISAGSGSVVFNVLQSG